MSRSRRTREQTDAAVQRLDANSGTSRNQPDLERYRDDPVSFVREVLKGKSKTRRSDGTPYQDEFLRSVADHDQVAIRTAHGCGKSTTLSWCALWWLVTRPGGLVICLAPTQDRQAKGVLLLEIQKWAKLGGIKLRQDGYTTYHDANGSRLVILSGASDTGNIEGQHADSVLLLCDEAKSLTRDTLDGVAGALTGKEAKEVMASTPGAAVGPFYDACTDGSGEWVAHHISAIDSDNVEMTWVERRRKRWGETSPTYAMRVKGEFVLDGSGQLFPWSLLHPARDLKDPVVPPSRPRYRSVTMGVDVGRSLLGDPSAVVVVGGGRLLHFESWYETDLMKSADRVETLATRFAPSRIRVDVGGIGGGLADRLSQRRLPVEHIYFGGRANDNESHLNWRAEAYLTLKRRLDERSLALPDDDGLLEELAALVLVPNPSGRTQLISKEELRKRLGRSTNYADALALAVAEGNPNFAPASAVSLHVGPATYLSLDHPSRSRPDGLVPSGDPVLRAWLARGNSLAS